MADYILELAKNPLARGLIGKLPLPVSLPPILKRTTSPWSPEEFTGKTTIVVAAGLPESTDSRFETAFVESMCRLGGRIIHHVPEGEKIDALLIDATGVRSPVGLEYIFLAAQKHIKHLHRPSRIVIAARSDHKTDEGKPAESQALTAALRAFVKSLGREVGGEGSNANLILFPTSAGRSAAEVACWFLSDRGAFISGQTVELNHKTTAESPTAGLLADKTAIVTGAARGIGLAICKALRREGAKVLGIDHPSQKDTLHDAMQDIGADTMIQDLSDSLAASQVAHAIKTFGAEGQVDIFIHNAGITRDRTLKRMSVAEWESVMRVNYEFPLSMARAMLHTDDAEKTLLASGGRLVTISSIVGLAGNFGQTNYSAAKGGVIGLTKDLATAHAEYSINAIACGFIETGMTAKIPPLMREIARRMNALKQGGLPEDVAEACLFLVGPHGSHINGQVLRVCGLHPAGA